MALPLPLPLPLVFFLPFFFLFIPSLSSPNATSTQIRSACNATRYPSLCVSLLSGSPYLPPNPTPTDVILAAISISKYTINVAKTKVEAILDSTAPPNINRTNGVTSCMDALLFSRRRLTAAYHALGLQEEPATVADARAWATAASLSHTGCWAGFKNVNDTIEVANAITVLSELTNVTNNALSMITALQRYGNDTSKWGPPQTERDGYWGPGDGAGGEIRSKMGVPSGLVPNATVCKDGSGCEYGAVQAAVDAAPVHGAGRFVIYIKEGVYEETVRVGFEQTNVVFIGDGMGRTVITGSLNARMVGMTTYNTATVGVMGDGFMAANLTFRNTAGPDAHQAVAFRSDSDLSILENVEFTGHQDTLYAHALRQLYKSCTISGTVDFIFGGGAALFQDSLIFIVPRQVDPGKGETNTVTAHGRTDPAQSAGFVFYNCVVNGSSEYVNYYDQKPSVHRNYLGRPWKDYSRTVFIDCYLEFVIRPEGWLNWNGDFALSTLFYGEFNSTGPGAANVMARVGWSSQIPEKHLGLYSAKNFIQME